MDPTVLIGDIVEKDSAEKPSTDFSDDHVSSTGFPNHKRRWKPSAFKQQRARQTPADTSPLQGEGENSTAHESSGPSAPPVSFEEVERRRIDQENRQKMDDMTPDEIAEAQREILNGMNPDLVQRLLRRSNIEDSADSRFFKTPERGPAPEIKVEEDAARPSKVRFAEDTKDEKPADAKPARRVANVSDDYDEDAEPPKLPPDLFPITDPPAAMHFPAPSRLPDLDPSDPDFLQALHEKYFPDLPADPGKMAWMAPVPSEDSVADRESPYYPHSQIAASALRFDFRGRFLSPRISRALPTSMGLHHHGEAPEAAGYTVTELARLARSAVPAQRCMAFQTLGRILYRLGKGEWGKTMNDPIAMGVWDAVKQGLILETLNEAAAAEGGHRGSQAFATEALWLFEKGGWKEKFKGR